MILHGGWVEGSGALETVGEKLSQGSFTKCNLTLASSTHVKSRGDRCTSKFPRRDLVRLVCTSFEPLMRWGTWEVKLRTNRKGGKFADVERIWTSIRFWQLGSRLARFGLQFLEMVIIPHRSNEVPCIGARILVVCLMGTVGKGGVKREKNTESRGTRLSPKKDPERNDCWVFGELLHLVA